MSKANKHVVPSASGGWAVKNAGAVRATRTFETQQKAVDFARRVARQDSTELFIHRRDGTIKDRLSYGRDPFPPRDKK